ncbi:peptidoglycan DD-metalloendopeptidase family protein [Halobacillus sp. H74]|uniref:peptidoglycan DD-metalloendopeptidase family protein n=1 Tax=Halobacillus sp. H74 TaxID=3457436 RepID=UPI003FCC53CC
MAGEPLRQYEEEQELPSKKKIIIKKATSLVFKKILLSLLPVGYIILIIILILTLFFAGLFFLNSQPEESKFGEWEVGGITEFGKNEIPAEYIPIYKAAGEKYNVPWNLLAAHHRVETVFSTIENMTSPVGAIGHMQFMPLTWIGWGYGGDRLGNANIPESIITSPAKIEQYGGYGQDANGDGKADPYDIEDAIYTAAHYLYENGINEGNIRKAVFAYNHADWYVEEVLGFADAYVSGYKAIDTQTPGEIKDGIAWPAPGIKGISSDYGMRTHPVTGIVSFHNGVDFNLPGSADLGNPIAAFREGTVIYAGFNGTYGNCVIIDHGDGMTSLYAHLNKIKTSVGTKVEPGQRIGDLGTTGRSTGPHLHFVIKINGEPVNPIQYLKHFL